MTSRLPLYVLALALFFPVTAGAGEIVKKTYTKANGQKVSGYVYQAGKSRRSYSRTTRSSSYPTFRSSGYTYSPSRSYGRSVHYGTCQPTRPAVRTTRTNITYQAACPITIGSPRSSIRAYRRR